MTWKMKRDGAREEAASIIVPIDSTETHCKTLSSVERAVSTTVICPNQQAHLAERISKKTYL